MGRARTFYSIPPKDDPIKPIEWAPPPDITNLISLGPPPLPFDEALRNYYGEFQTSPPTRTEAPPQRMIEFANIPPHLTSMVFGMGFPGWHFAVSPNPLEEESGIAFRLSASCGGQGIGKSSSYVYDIPNDMVAAGALDPATLKRFLTDAVADIMDRHVRCMLRFDHA